MYRPRRKANYHLPIIAVIIGIFGVCLVLLMKQQQDTSKNIASIQSTLEETSQPQAKFTTQSVQANTGDVSIPGCSFEDISTHTACVQTGNIASQYIDLDYTLSGARVGHVTAAIINTAGAIEDYRVDLPLSSIRFIVDEGKQSTGYTLTLAYSSGSVSCDSEKMIAVALCESTGTGGIIEEICDNALDDDGDAYVDCADSDCADFSSCVGSGTAVCGNAKIETGEQCDDGNTREGDGCNDTCQEEYCGDGYADINGRDNNLASSVDNEECGEPGLVCKDGFKCIPISCVCIIDNDGGSNDSPVDPPSTGLCGARHSTEIYDPYANGGGLTSTTVGLCTTGSTPINFIFDRRKRAWQWMCITPDDIRDTCNATALRCGDGERNGEEICEGEDIAYCAEGEICSNTCECIAHNEDAVCGSLHEDQVYSEIAKPSGISGKKKEYCEAGEQGELEYNEEYDAWYRDCEGLGTGSTVGCYAYRLFCGNGYIEEDETCDDGNTASGDGCDNRCRTEGSVAIGGPVAIEGCGNAVLDPGEQCDDGNLLDDDGCDSECEIENGWKCTVSSPSTCGSLECAQHGEWYSENNIFGQCCGGLEAIEFEKTPEKLIASGVNLTLCYDPLIQEPICYPDKKTPGRYVALDTTGDEKLILEDSCSHILQNYYTLIDGLFSEEHLECQYDDVSYTQIEFKDVALHSHKSSIITLLDSCIVKGPGERYIRFQPNKKINRAEFTKMLIKVIFLGYDFDVISETLPYQGKTYFTDVSKTFWGAQYITKAYEMGVLEPLVGTVAADSQASFLPYSSMTQHDIIQVMLRVDVGKNLSMKEMKTILGNETFPSRGAVAALLVEKFADHFSSYVSMEGNNQVYFDILRNHLKGKSYSDQYDVIINQLDLLGANSEIHGAAAEVDVDFGAIHGYLGGLIK